MILFADALLMTGHTISCLTDMVVLPSKKNMATAN